MVKKPQVMMQNLLKGIVVNPRTDALALQLPGNYRHLFENKEDWSRIHDLALILQSYNSDVYLGGGTVNHWLYRGERGRDTDLLAVVKKERIPEWFIQLVSAGNEVTPQERTVQLGNYGYILGNQLVRKYMNIDSGVEGVKLVPLRTIDERSKHIVPQTIDLSLTSQANFRRCYKNLNRGEA